MLRIVVEAMSDEVYNKWNSGYCYPTMALLIENPNQRSDHITVDTAHTSAADQTAESAPRRIRLRLACLCNAARASPDGRNAAASAPMLHSGSGAGYRRRS